MRRWIIAVLFSILLSCAAVSGAAADPMDSGRSPLNFPMFQMPIGSTSSSNAEREKKDAEAAAFDEKKEKEMRDKKVDDAIKKAWEEK